MWITERRYKHEKHETYALLVEANETALCYHNMQSHDAMMQ